MIYTIGRTEDYERYFEEQGTPEKLGKTDDYIGGSVWKTKEEAEVWCLPRYSVYGVEADWDTDTYQHDHESFRSLLTTSNLVRL